jgi:hypothetical protein
VAGCAPLGGTSSWRKRERDSVELKKIQFMERQREFEDHHGWTGFFVELASF